MSLPTLLPPEWSNEKIIKFLELYEIERVIWDPHDKNHKLKHKVHDAWNRISNNLDKIPIEELKSKKKSLMATFRPLLKKKKKSIRSGAGTDDVFQPIWFAFEIMERFLGTLYDVEETINTEHSNLHSEDAPIQYQPDVEIQSKQNIEMSLPSPSQPVPSPSQPVLSPLPVHTRPNKTRKKASLNADEAQDKISQTLDTLNQVLKDKRNITNDEDECEVYGKLLAKRLRKYPESMRARIMYGIDGFLLENPYPIDRPSSQNAYISASSSQSQYSDYQTSTPSPVHVIPQTEQSQHVYVMQPTVPESSVHLHIPKTHVIPQTQQSQHVYVMEPSVSLSSEKPSITEMNITSQNLKAYWKATEM